MGKLHIQHGGIMMISMNISGVFIYYLSLPLLRKFLIVVNLQVSFLLWIELASKEGFFISAETKGTEESKL